MNNDNLSVFIFTLTELANEHNCKISYSNDHKDRSMVVRFHTDTGALFGQIIVMDEHIYNSAFPTTYARSLFRQMLKKREKGEE